IISWRAPEDSSEIAGYYIFRNGKLVANIQTENRRRNLFRNTYFENSYLKKGVYKYEVCAYSFTGTTTLKMNVESEIN
ncbi:MAG TPA: hypothetical protein VIL78_21335, partial [Hanamia sp.]